MKVRAPRSESAAPRRGRKRSCRSPGCREQRGPAGVSLRLGGHGATPRSGRAPSGLGAAGVGGPPAPPHAFSHRSLLGEVPSARRGAAETLSELAPACDRCRPALPSPLTAAGSSHQLLTPHGHLTQRPLACLILSRRLFDQKSWEMPPPLHVR